jgi:hypothetical protein
MQKAVWQPFDETNFKRLAGHERHLFFMATVPFIPNSPEYV